MAFLDETGLATLWGLIKARDVKLAVGSYTGTGTYGPNNPNSLTFDFAPKILMVFRTDTGTGKANGNLARPDASVCYFIQNLNLLTTSYVSGRGFGAQSYMGPFGKKSSDGKTISWYEDINQAEYQLNKSGQTYSYVAFG